MASDPRAGPPFSLHVPPERITVAVTVHHEGGTATRTEMTLTELARRLAPLLAQLAAEPAGDQGSPSASELRGS